MSNIKIGKIVEGQITGVTKYGVFVSLEDNYTGMIHISEVSNKYIEDLNNIFKIGDLIRVKVLSIDENKLQVKLSIKKIGKQTKRKGIEEKGKGFEPLKQNLSEWIKEKMEEIEKNKIYLKNLIFCIDIKTNKCYI